MICDLYNEKVSITIKEIQTIFVKNRVHQSTSKISQCSIFSASSLRKFHALSPLKDFVRAHLDKILYVL